MKSANELQGSVICLRDEWMFTPEVSRLWTTLAKRGHVPQHNAKAGVGRDHRLGNARVYPKRTMNVPWKRARRYSCKAGLAGQN